MTKAERIFKDTYRECRKHVATWGFDGNGFNEMATDELIYTRTVNEIKKFMVAEAKEIKFLYQLGVITLDEAKEKLNALEMVKATLKNQYVA